MNKKALKKKTPFKKTPFWLIFFFCLPSCYFNTSGVSTTHNHPSIGEEFSASDSEWFYVDLDLHAYESSGERVPLYDINTTEIIGDSISRDSPSNCEIEHIPREDDEEERSSTETKICILEAPEWAFTLKDLHLVFNVPSDMCETVSWALPWHFNFPIIAGPISIQCPVEIGDEKEELYCNADYDSTTLEKSCPSSASETSCHKEEEDLCPSSPGAPKCCNGGEKGDGKKWYPEQECFGGPALVSKQINPEDFAKTFNQIVPKDGLRMTISLKQLLEINAAPENIPHANYHTKLDLSFKELKSLNRNSLPNFLRPSEYYGKAPQLFFYFACWDPAHEAYHELLVLYREWNTLEEFRKLYSSTGKSEGDPDVEGLEGENGDCEYDERIYLNQCNDWKDLDDYSTYPRHVIRKETFSSRQ